MNKEAIIAQLVKLLEVNYIDCVEAKTILKNANIISWLIVAKIAFALFEYARDNRLDKQQVANCKIVIDILEAIAE